MHACLHAPAPRPPQPPVFPPTWVHHKVGFALRGRRCPLLCNHLLHGVKLPPPRVQRRRPRLLLHAAVPTGSQAFPPLAQDSPEGQKIGGGGSRVSRLRTHTARGNHPGAGSLHACHRAASLPHRANSQAIKAVIMSARVAPKPMATYDMNVDALMPDTRCCSATAAPGSESRACGSGVAVEAAAPAAAAQGWCCERA